MQNPLFVPLRHLFLLLGQKRGFVFFARCDSPSSRDKFLLLQWAYFRLFYPPKKTRQGPFFCPAGPGKFLAEDAAFALFPSPVTTQKWCCWSFFCPVPRQISNSAALLEVQAAALIYALAPIDSKQLSQLNCHRPLDHDLPPYLRRRLREPRASSHRAKKTKPLFCPPQGE
jgi:hypothetical protein